MTVPDAAAATAAAAAFGAADAVSLFEERGGSWRVEGLAREEPDRSQLAVRLALAWLGRVGSPPEIHWERLAQIDWLGVNRASFPPLAAGRFFIRGSHFAGRVPAGCIALVIDAATAFGTGEHATTRGCLLALDALGRGRNRKVLDMGTGTGILAIAAAKAWRCRVEACDIDAEAVRVAAHNVRRNGVAGLITVSRSAGYAGRRVAGRAPYDVVFANILARPLEAMARDLGRFLAPDGVAVLSGLLSWQESGVLAAHRSAGLRLKLRIVIDGWSTLVLGRARPRSFRFLRKPVRS